MLELNKIYNIDNRIGLEELNDECCNLVITSPPYKDKDGYTDGLIEDTFSLCYTVLKKNSLCFVNFGHLANFKSRPFQVVSILEDLGFVLQETITWIKTQYSPIQGKKRINNLTEFIFMFSKGKMPDLDRLSIGVPYAHKSNVKRYAKGKDLKCRGNSWTIPYETIQKKSQKLHSDRFPLELPIKCIKLANLKSNSLIIDPFMGSGTTALAAKQLGHNYIGFEKNEKHVKTSNKRLLDYEQSLKTS